MKAEEQKVKNEMLREAVSKGDLDLVKALIKIGADVHQKFKGNEIGHNFTLLSLAGRHPKVKEFLNQILNPSKFSPERLKVEEELRKVMEAE